jgi:hypothetical protein
LLTLARLGRFIYPWYACFFSTILESGPCHVFIVRDKREQRPKSDRKRERERENEQEIKSERGERNEAGVALIASRRLVAWSLGW